MAGECDWRFGDFGGDGVGGSLLGVSRSDLVQRVCGGLGSDEALMIRWLVL
ncbi:hypothetical protein TIFTF001_004138 [Ficus carica]|uniref:Uncharacterized protein n=1 Tax=Ficus carica TaxID=3494 RepID=A0AA88CWP2_FICCA|nr:hypothetical protein TIFTF001_004138 [Ficus carica]